MTGSYRIVRAFVTGLLVLVPLSGLAEAPITKPESEEKSGLWEGVKSLPERFKKTDEQAQPTITERLREDAQRIGTWEYRVVSLPAQDAELEKELNTLGLDRWEAFSVQHDGEGFRVFLKRPASTYLKAIPMSEYLRLIPKAEQGDGASSQ